MDSMMLHVWKLHIMHLNIWVLLYSLCYVGLMQQKERKLLCRGLPKGLHLASFKKIWLYKINKLLNIKLFLHHFFFFFFSLWSFSFVSDQVVGFHHFKKYLWTFRIFFLHMTSQAVCEMTFIFYPLYCTFKSIKNNCSLLNKAGLMRSINRS